MRLRWRRTILLPALAAALLVLPGCARYWRYRGEDFMEIIDIGVTYSAERQWGFYQSFESILVIGYGNFDVTFIGWGGGRFGVTPHHFKGWGALVWGDEQIGWGDYDRDDPSTLYEQTTGLVGMPTGMVKGNSNPHYVPT